MAKNKKSGIPHYELLYIVANKFTEDDLKGINTRVNKLIEEHGGKITFKEDWGKKKFCFPIEHRRFGYYQFVEFDIESNLIEKINTDLRMSNEVLRHMIVNHAPKTQKQITLCSKTYLFTNTAGSSASDPSFGWRKTRYTNS